VKKLAIIAIAVGLMACGGKKKDEAATGSGSAVAMAGSGSAMMAGSGSAAMAGSGSGSAGSAAAAKADVPTEQDFEQQAAKDIDDKNVEAKVGEIEKQIGQ
jgi:hypothetical protein